MKNKHWCSYSYALENQTRKYLWWTAYDEHRYESWSIDHEDAVCVQSLAAINLEFIYIENAATQKNIFTSGQTWISCLHYVTTSYCFAYPCSFKCFTLRCSKRAQSWRVFGIPVRRHHLALYGVGSGIQKHPVKGLVLETHHSTKTWRHLCKENSNNNQDIATKMIYL